MMADRSFSRTGSAKVLPSVLHFHGHPAILRRLETTDSDRLIRFFESHTPETIHQRYGYLFGHMSPDRAANLVGVDQSHDCALGVFEGSEDVLIAVARYCLAAGGSSAEMAFVVREDRRRRGMASALFQVLLGVARERGLTRLTAQVARENFPMLAIFRKAGAAVTGAGDSGVARITINLSPGNPTVTIHP